MKPYILEETNWKQIKSQKYEVATLPWGATEPHNYHLPYGTDSLETAKIAALAAKKAWDQGAKVMVLPTIPLGAQNVGQIDMPFCLHTPPSTQLLILKDLVTALNRQGIKKLVIMNGHGGNGEQKASKLKAMREKTAWAPRQWDKVSDDSGIGDPRLASAAKGEKFVNDVTDKIAAYFVELATSNIHDLYE